MGAAQIVLGSPLEKNLEGCSTLATCYDVVCKK